MKWKCWISSLAVLAAAGCAGPEATDEDTPSGLAAESDAPICPPTDPRPIEGGEVRGAITGGQGPSIPTPPQLAAAGFVESEFVLGGEATTYKAQGPLGADGVWNAVPNGKAPYQTRLVVRRPSDASKYNGTVLIEWLNTTTGADAPVAWGFGWEEILRGGYAYVGVTVQKAGVDAAKKADAARYGTLVHPGDQYGYDIFAQAGAVIGWPGKVDVLGGLRPERLLAYGESQSAMRMITFANAIHPRTKVFDGFVIHSRAAWGAPIGTEGDPLLGNLAPVRVRADLDAKVMQFLTETELFFPLGGTVATRQPDTDKLRTWEVAGTAHADQHLLGDRSSGCGTINDGPQHWVVKTALRGMHRWLKDGVAPPSGAPIELNAGKTAIARGPDGNALGGIRTPAVDVPIAKLSGEPSPQFWWNPLCLLFGHTIPFTPARLLELYPTHDAYVTKVTAAARAAREAGFVLPEDEPAIVAEAAAAKIPQ